MEQIFLATIKYVAPPLSTLILGYGIRYYQEKNSRKIAHDKNIFHKMSKILSDNEFMEIFEHSDTGYLPPRTLWKCDALDYFVKNPANKFINKNLNEKFINFENTFSELCQLYAGSNYGGYLNNHDHANSKFKLLLNKRGDPEEEKILKKNWLLSKNVREKYQIFRLELKKQLLI